MPFALNAIGIIFYQFARQSLVDFHRSFVSLCTKMMLTCIFLRLTLHTDITDLQTFIVSGLACLIDVCSC